MLFNVKYRSAFKLSVLFYSEILHENININHPKQNHYVIKHLQLTVYSTNTILIQTLEL